MLFAHSLPVLGWDEALLRLALAAALGGVIGVERELQERAIAQAGEAASA